MGTKGKTVADYPELVAQWHPTKNVGLRPQQFSAGSSKKVWWKCPKGPDHEWDASVSHRTRGRGCPMCRGFRPSITNSLASGSGADPLGIDGAMGRWKVTLRYRGSDINRGTWCRTRRNHYEKDPLAKTASLCWALGFEVGWRAPRGSPILAGRPLHSSYRRF